VNPAPVPVWLDSGDPSFPDVTQALKDPDGLLALGGDLSSERLLNAYRHGIFPWYSDGQPILWWSPDPRLVLLPGKLHVSRSLAKTIRKGTFSVTLDQDFSGVIKACTAPRVNQDGTWITKEMSDAYIRLFETGYAHSVECWQAGQLAGGLYGIAIGRVFFGESMFSRAADASKVAFVRLVRQLEEWNFTLVDCQIYTTHLASLGAENISRKQFVQTLGTGCELSGVDSPWAFETD
jgi:leucyl/phenylalanyl-tRNA--protein transferase